jgi:hypothetical protein
MTNEEKISMPALAAVYCPSHYTSHSSGVECIEIAQGMPFCLGNALKYVWRAGKKDPEAATEDVKKAIWYLHRQISFEMAEEERWRMPADLVGKALKVMESMEDVEINLLGGFLRRLIRPYEQSRGEIDLGDLANFLMRELDSVYVA